MHFSGDISLGQLATILAILAVGVKFHRSWVTVTERVGMLWADYEARHHLFERRCGNFNPIPAVPEDRDEG